MEKIRLLKWLFVLIALLGIGAVVGGGIVLATTSTSQTDAATVIVSAAENTAEPGVVIASVEPDGPAAAAGVSRGDILLEFEDQEINTVFELWNILAEKEIGDQVALRVLHGDDERTLTATLGEQAGRPYLGVRPCDGLPGLPGLTVLDDLPQIERMPLMPETLGAVIVRVSPDSPAEQAGLQKGDRITQVDGKELDFENGLADLITAHEPGETVTLEITRSGEEPFDVTVELAEHPDKQGVAYLGVEFQPLLHYQLRRDSEGDSQPFGERFIKPFPFDGAPLFRLPEGEGEQQQGVIVRRVTGDSPAEKAGLNDGAVITAVDGEPLQEPKDLLDAISQRQPGDLLTLTVLGPDEDEIEERQVQVTLAEHPDDAEQAYLGVIIGGVFRSWRSGDHAPVPGMPRIEPFMKKFHQKHPFSFDGGFGFDFDWQPDHFERLPFDFDFGFPPTFFQEEPCCSKDSTL